MILECYGVIISENGFNLFLRPIMMYFKKIEIPNYNYKFIEESDNSEDDNDREIEELESTNIFIKNEVQKEESEVEKYSETSSDSE